VSFKTDDKGRRVFDFPRLTIRIGGEDTPMLFDTGATTVLAATALEIIGDGMPSMRATSMIAHSTFEAWHKRNPDWKIIDDGQLATQSRMILAPDLAIGRIHVGAVWFTERPDKNFHEFMSSMMSDRVDGSLGGNALRNLAIGIDYPIIPTRKHGFGDNASE
jgi:hypothetical protein